VASAFHCWSSDGNFASICSPTELDTPWHVGQDGQLPGGSPVGTEPLPSEVDPPSSGSSVPSHLWQHALMAFCAKLWTTGSARCIVPHAVPASTDAWQQHSGDQTPMSRATRIRSIG
jgi:hypothetical protein